MKTVKTCNDSDRRISRVHQQYNMTTYTPLWNIADQYAIMWPQTMQDLLISIGLLLEYFIKLFSCYGPYSPFIYPTAAMFDSNSCKHRYTLL